MAPEHGVRRDWIEFFVEVFLDEFCHRAFGPVGELLEILGKRTHVLVVLLRIELERFKGKFPCGPLMEVPSGITRVWHIAQEKLPSSTLPFSRMT